MSIFGSLASTDEARLVKEALREAWRAGYASACSDADANEERSDGAEYVETPSPYEDGTP